MMELFGTTKQGEDVHKITISAGDLTVSILTRGAVLQDARLAGVDRSLTLGSDNLADYEDAMKYHGAIVGPIANRVSNARIKIDGMMYELERNMLGRIHLHSGSDGVHTRIWDVAKETADSVTLTCHLPDGAAGLPGDRLITATFTVAAPGTLTLTMTGTTDAATPMNFANHSYWNLDGTEKWDGHTLRVAADHYLPCNEDFFPTGDIADVTGTHMDLRTARAIFPGTDTHDNNYCLSDTPTALRDVLWLTGATGVSLAIGTNLPGIQVYDGRDAIRPGHAAYEGIAIEPQYWPDATNNPDFPQILVSPDTPYSQISTWTFSKG